MKTFIVSIAAALSLSCAGVTPDYIVDGVEVYVTSPAPYLHAANTEAGLQRTLDVAFAYWQGWGFKHPVEPIRLYLVTPAEMPTGVGGLTDHDLVGWRIRLADNAGPLPGCVEGLALPHEIGHTMGAPADHSGPAWAALSAATFPQLLPYCQ